MSLTIQLHERDNVAVARTELRVGTLLAEFSGVEVLNLVPRFHKVAVNDIVAGELIRKYDQVIGVASQYIRQGEHVHSHNCCMPDASIPRKVASIHKQEAKAFSLPKHLPDTFLGYRRANGRSGTRNYIGIVTSVNCSATVAKQIEKHFADSDFIKQFPNVDGVVAFTHATGCGMSKGDGYDILNRVYTGYTNHPNFSAVLMIGLGCEVMQLADFKERENLEESVRFRSLIIQQQGGTRKTVDAGISIVEDMVRAAAQLEREPISVRELAVGLQCGGSDALSGITANPSLGAAMDILVAQGGTAILSETPEIYGAEHLLIERAESNAVGQALLNCLDWWEAYTEKNGAELNNNPSPGNKAGGLTTILEKSLGAQAKAGNSILRGVYDYAAPIDKHGLVVMDSPGYDPVSVTGQMASGANMICFTTGRGSAFGAKPAPSLKLATNTPLYESMEEDMDINCGAVFDGELTVKECGEVIYRALITCASGQKSKSEMLDYGHHEFLPWLIGAVV
jgi:altronate hydrolase